MLKDIAKALRQLEDSRTRNLLLTVAGASLSVLVVLVGASWLLISQLALSGWGWVDGILHVVGVAGAGFIAWFAFPILVSSTLAFFADDICDAVEKRHYPDLPPARHQPLGEAIGEGMSFAALALLLNLLVLPLYLLPGPNIIIYLSLNGWLLGREYFGVVALRRGAPEQVTSLRRSLRPRIWLAGAAIAFTLTIPLVNLVAPLFGVAFMTHRYHRMTSPPNSIIG